ncbi:Hypothetical predicted protein [Octopus vulgaris]|uniref:Uncharacterized protein n=2 Tax=Octopus TaxID=6643 RepID=A0AA36BNT8_OCTVU|nr:protein FAM210A [Octopus sinensis]CAI9737414.1 Hypothetical predicted protein [Octopus vulgaris]
MIYPRLALGLNFVHRMNQTCVNKNVVQLCARCNFLSNHHHKEERHFISSWSRLKVNATEANRPLFFSSYNHLQLIPGPKYGRQNNINLTNQLVSSAYCRNFRTNSFHKTSRVQRNGDDIDKETPKGLSIFQRFKQAYKQHGKVLIGVHLATSAVWLGSFYYLTITGFDIIPVLERLNVSETIINQFKKSGIGNIAVAYLMYKLATPARYAVTLAGTNLAIRYFKKTGRMKPVPDEAKFKALYSDSKIYLNARRKQLKKSRLLKMKKRFLKLKKLRKKRF